MVAHSSLTGSDLHEVKGATSALSGTILKANGDGTTSFVDPLTLTNIELGTPATAYNSSNIMPSAVDTPIIAGFSTVSSSSDVTIDTSGTMTINTTGLYFLTFNHNFGRTTSVGTAIIASRLLINDVQFGYTQATSLADVQSSRPFQVSVIRPCVAGDVLKIQVIRDSAGANDGGFVAQNITLADWVDQPSYWVRASRVIGGA